MFGYGDYWWMLSKMTTILLHCLKSTMMWYVAIKMFILVYNGVVTWP
jgi:hypothetical protein